MGVITLAGDWLLNSARLDHDPPEPLITEPLIRIRMQTLQSMCIERLNPLSQEDDVHQTVAFWYGLVDIARQAEEQDAKNPESHEVFGQHSFGVFYLIDSIFENTGEPPELPVGLRNSLMAIEELHAGRLAYVLCTAPPRLNLDNDEELTKLIAEEKELIEDLRGAAFLLALKKLPGHYRRYIVLGDDAWEALEDPRRQLTEETGRKQLQTIESKLRSLYGRMRKRAPDYARQRLDPHAEWIDIVRAMAAHSGSTLPTRDQQILEIMARYRELDSEDRIEGGI